MLQGRKPAQPVTDMLAAHITETFNQEMGNQEMGRAERNAA
jgi:hypothetical protein